MNYFNIHRKIRLLIPFIFFLAIFLTYMSDSHAAPAGYSQYFVPGEEEKIAIVFEDTANNRTLGRVGGITKAIYSAIGITSWSDNTRIYIDHWEDGYEFDPDDPVDTADEVCPVQNTGSFLNLISQDVPSVLAERTGLGGDCLNIATPCATPITANGCYYDGKDLIFVAGGSATLTRTVMPEQVCNDTNFDGNCTAPPDTNIQPNPATLGDGQAATVQALAWEVYPVRPQLTTYIMPFGEDLYALGMLDFDHVLALVQATEDNTSVQVDFDADGTYDAVDANLDGDCNDAGDGTVITLDMGETLLLSRNSDGNGGAGCGSATALNTQTFIQGTSTLQVNYISGNAGYLYDIRGYAAFPRGFWDNEYYAPVDSGAGGHDTDIYIHNPWGASITIDYQNSTGSGSLTVPANSTVSFYDETGAYVPDNSSVYLNSQGGEEFWAVSAIDTEDGAGTYNWSYPLVPAYLLDNEYFVGYAPGSVPVTGPTDYDNSGLFIATVQDNTTVFVDYDADGPRAPVTYTLNRLQTQFIYDSVDGDLSGTSIISTGPFIAAWGENPETATVPTGLPALDAGYVGLPGRSDWIDLVLMVDKSTAPVIIGTGTGQTTKYTITVSTDEFDVEDVRVTDILATGWAFCTTTTVPACAAPVITFPDLTTSNDTPSIDVFDVIDGRLDIDDNGVVDANDDGMFDGITVINGYLDTNESGAIDAGDDGAAGRDGINVIDGGLDINGSGTITVTDDATNFTGRNLTWDSTRFTGGQKDMAPNQTMTIEYWAYTTATHTSGSVTVSPVEASADRTVGDPSVTQTFTATDSVFNLYTTSNMSISKTSDVATVAYPGDTIAYTVTINNTGPSTLTGVAIYDPMPDGVNYVSGSGSVTCELQQNYRDEFGAIAYNNTNGSVNWSTNSWTETDSYGTGPGGSGAGPLGGFVRIWAGQLQFRYLLSFVSDDFSTAASYADNDGSNNWTAAWTETNDDGTAGGGYIVVTGGYARFRGGSGVPPAQANRAISRTATVTGATSATINFTLSDNGIDAGETMEAHYSIDGGAYVLIGTLDGATGWSGSALPLTIALASNNTLTIRFRAPQVWSSTSNDEARVDNVNISFNSPANASGTQIQRTANLTGAITPQLNFSYSSANLEAGDTLVIEASSSAVGPFTTLATFAGGTPSLAPPYDLTPYISATTTIQFRITGGYNVNDETFSIDNVDITYGVSSTFASGSPPNFLSSSTGCSIQPGNSLTLTFNVTIDDPLDSGITEITNTAYATSTQIPLPIDASVTDPVVNPSSDSSSIGDFVWLDSNGDGDWDTGEPGLQNIEVTLKDSFGTPLLTTTTDSQGHYLFTGVTPGTGYYVEVTDGLPSGLTQSAPSGHTDNRTDPFNLKVSKENNRDEFGAVAYDNSDGPVSWTANPWVETDGLGGGAGGGEILITGGELRINNDTSPGFNSIYRPLSIPADATMATLSFDWRTTGVEAADSIILDISKDGGSYTTLETFTDIAGVSSGNWSLDISDYLSSGTTIRFRVAAGYAAADDLFFIDNVNIEYFSILTEYMDADLGYKPDAGTATFGDLVWSDFDSDGVRDTGEPGLTGVTVQLWLDDGDLLWDPGTDSLISSTVTAAGGSYLFTGVTPTGTEDYFLFVDPTQAALTGFTSTTVDPLLVQNVNAGDVILTLDFGFRNAAGTYTITDRVWYDANGDSEDDGESGIGGVTVDLLDASLNVIASTITDANGYFSFNGVIGAGADYTLLITDTGSKLNDYYGITAGAIAGEVDINNLSSNLDFTVEPTEPNFGYGLSKSISGTVFNDLDGDGSLDAGEPGMGGIDISLYNDVNSDGLLDGGDTLESTLPTDSNGNYLFSGLDNGNYIVSIPSPPSNYDYTTEIPDNDPAAGDQQTATIAGGGNVQNKNFGYEAQDPRGISGTLWEDDDADGVIDAGENGLEGVTIDLLDGSTVVASTSTDSNGEYSFSGLTPITYTVRITDTLGVLSGYETTYEFGGPPLDGEASADLSGGDLTDVNFGYREPVVTLVILSSFRAFEDKGKVVIEWTTSSEIDTAGFYLFRLDEPTGDYTRINSKLLPALLTSPQGGTYSLIDRAASPGGSYTYILTEVEGKGKMLTYGPFTVQVGRYSAVTKGLSYVGADQYSDYTRKEHKSAGKENRIKTLKEMKSATAVQKSTLSGNIAKISVTEDGLYYLSASQISTLLGTSSKDIMKRIKNTQLIIRNQGQKVAYLPSAGYTGIFFYGEGIDSIYTKENIYWLERNKGLQMEYIEGKGPDQTGAGTFTETLHAEEDRHFIANSYMDPESDYWFWDYIVGGNASMGARTYTIQADGVADISYNALLTVNLQGYTNTSANPDHHVEVSLNGTTLVPSAPGSDRWNGEEPHSVTCEIDQSIEDLLLEGDNTVVVKGLLDTGAPYSVFYVDSLDLTYQRLYEAVGNTLLFRGEGSQVVTVYGFTSSDILVFDVTDSKKPKLNKATTVGGQAGNYTVSFTPASPDTLYLAISSDAAITDVNAWADTPSSLSSGNGADYIVITIEELADAAQSLADYRQSQGLKTMVVKLEDIMDEFNNGIYSPKAIHDFLTHAYQNWSNPPKYVVLAGDGSYDYKDNQGHGDNLIPTMIVHTPSGLFPSDNLFADVDNDHVPEMAVGRLPVITPDELLDVLNKIIAYEGSVRNRIILTADNPDSGGNYPTDSEEIAALVLPQYPVVKIYLSAYQADQARQMLLNEMNTGGFLLNYIGHAGVDLLADEGLLRKSDLGSLTNLYGLPVVTAMTCIVGQFALPGYDSLSEELVIKTDGGAVAVWAPTGLSYNAQSRILDQEFFKAAFQNNTAVLGDSILQALKEYSAKGTTTFTMDIYNLQGDPALKIR